MPEIQTGTSYYKRANQSGGFDAVDQYGNVQDPNNFAKEANLKGGAATAIDQLPVFQPTVGSSPATQSDPSSQWMSRITPPKSQDQYIEEARTRSKGIIDTIETQFASAIKGEQEAQTGREARANALSVSSGLSGSSFGESAKGVVKTTGQENMKQLEQQRSVAISKALVDIDNLAIEQKQQDEQQYTANVTTGLNIEASQQARKDATEKKALDSLKSLAGSGVDFDKFQADSSYETLKKSLGYTDLQMKMNWDANLPDNMKPITQSYTKADANGNAQYIRITIDPNNPKNIKTNTYDLGIPYAQITDSVTKEIDGILYQQDPTTKDWKAVTPPSATKELANKKTLLEIQKLQGEINVGGSGQPYTGPIVKSEYNQVGLLANTSFNEANIQDKDAKYYLDQYLKTGKQPSYRDIFGYRKDGVLADVQNRADDLFYEATGSSLPDSNILAATKKLVADNNSVLNKQQILADTIERNFTLAIKGEITNNVNQNATVVNRLLNPFYLALGNPAVNAAMVSNGTISQEFANLISVRNATGTTVSDKEVAGELIKFGTSVKAQKAVVERLMKEAMNIQGALTQQNSKLYQVIDPLETNINNPNRKKNGAGQSGQYTPGQVVEYQGKQYKVGADGDSLEPL